MGSHETATTEVLANEPTMDEEVSTESLPNTAALKRYNLVLASASPARLATLRSAGFDPTVSVSGVDEDAVAASLNNPTPVELCQALATAKAEAVRRTYRLPADHANENPDSHRTLIVGCDSILELDGAIHGKPYTVEVARDRWQRMAGRAGLLHTGHCVIDATTGHQAAGTASTTVRFGNPTEAELDAYLTTGEPLNVAGAFTIDGRGGPFIDGIDGDPHTVVGISLPLLRRLLADLGITITDLWR